MGGLGNKEIMSRNIQYYMTINGKSRAEVCEAIGVKYTTFTDWVNGNTYPRIDKIELMANYFGISKSDLVEERNTQRSNIVLTDDEIDMIIKIRQMDDRGKQSVLSTIEREYKYVPHEFAGQYRIYEFAKKHGIDLDAKKIDLNKEDTNEKN